MMDQSDPNYPFRRRPPLWMPLLVIGGMVVASFLIVMLVVAHDRTSPPPAQRNLAVAAGEDLERRNFRPLSRPLEELLADPNYKPVPTQAHPLLGKPAPDFTLSDAYKKDWSLTLRLKKGPVVLVFYYGYYCNHCVSQLFALHKDADKFHELGAEVVAISADTPELTRERFKEYGAFAFPVLCDPGHKVARKFGTIRGSVEGEGEPSHGTFIISRSGRVVWANRGGEPFTENLTLLLELARCEKRQP
jgi:thioredoxin-dependent peroxiredoxin